MNIRHRLMLTVSALVSVTSVAGGAFAAEDQDLRALLAALPASVFTSADLGYVEYLNLSRLVPEGTEVSSGTLQGVALGGNIRPLPAIGADPAEFRERAGVGPEDLTWLGGFGQAPKEISLWGFSDGQAAQTAFEGLSALGFARAGFLPGVVANGEQGAMDFSRADPKDPWLGPMGRTSTVTARDSVLLQAGTAADFAPVLGATATAIDSDAGRLALAGVEHETDGVLQALILSPVTVGAQAIDPAFLIGKSPEEASAAFEVEAANLAAGLPLYSAAILAEVATVQGPQVVISLAYPHCDDATAAVSRAPALWDLMNPSYMPAPAEISGEVVEAAPGCAARITLTPTAEGDAGNLAVLRSVVTGIQFRDVAILRIGAEPAGVSPE